MVSGEWRVVSGSVVGCSVAIAPDLVIKEGDHCRHEAAVDIRNGGKSSEVAVRNLWWEHAVRCAVSVVCGDGEGEGAMAGMETRMGMWRGWRYGWGGGGLARGDGRRYVGLRAWDCMRGIACVRLHA